MKKILLLFTTTAMLFLSGCAIGGADEADKLKGTWVSNNSYTYNFDSTYVYYDFNPESVDLLDGNQSGDYRIRAYEDNFWYGTNYTVVEEGKYSTDYLSGIITLKPTNAFSRTLDYDLNDDSLELTDRSWWGNNRIYLRKL